MERYILCSLLSLVIFGCNRPKTEPLHHSTAKIDTTVLAGDNSLTSKAPTVGINTGDVQPQDIVAFAKTLKGVPYAYACSSPDQGFDCSGFINYVFDHFNIEVPRSSADFANMGKDVPVDEAVPGDLILFTGTNNSIRRVGHIGIVVYNTADSLTFIHSSSGSANGVTVTPLNAYYKRRFVKIVRLFNQAQSTDGKA